MKYYPIGNFNGPVAAMFDHQLTLGQDNVKNISIKFEYKNAKDDRRWMPSDDNSSHDHWVRHAKKAIMFMHCVLYKISNKVTNKAVSL